MHCCIRAGEWVCGGRETERERQRETQSVCVRERKRDTECVRERETEGEIESVRIFVNKISSPPVHFPSQL